MILNSSMHFLALVAALIGVFGSTSTIDDEGKRQVIWLGWAAVTVALGISRKTQNLGLC